MSKEEMKEPADMVTRQNNLIISLLGRLAFPEDKLKDIITKNSKRSKQMIKAYNLCDGKLTTGQIAKKLNGVTPQALNKATLRWEENGIIMNLGESGKGKDKIPLRLYKLIEDGKDEK